MTITCEITDLSTPTKPSIRIHNAWNNGRRVELEVNGARYTIDGEELISAIRRCLLITDQ